MQKAIIHAIKSVYILILLVVINYRVLSLFVFVLMLLTYYPIYQLNLDCGTTWSPKHNGIVQGVMQGTTWSQCRTSVLKIQTILNDIWYIHFTRYSMYCVLCKVLCFPLLGNYTNITQS